MKLTCMTQKELDLKELDLGIGGGGGGDSLVNLKQYLRLNKIFSSQQKLKKVLDLFLLQIVILMVEKSLMRFKYFRKVTKLLSTSGYSKWCHFALLSDLITQFIEPRIGQGLKYCLWFQRSQFQITLRLRFSVWPVWCIYVYIISGVNAQCKVFHPLALIDYITSARWWTWSIG